MIVVLSYSFISLTLDVIVIKWEKIWKCQAQDNQKKTTGDKDKK